MGEKCQADTTFFSIFILFFMFLRYYRKMAQKNAANREKKDL